MKVVLNVIRELCIWKANKQTRPAFTGFMCMFVSYANSLKLVQHHIATDRT